MSLKIQESFEAIIHSANSKQNVLSHNLKTVLEPLRMLRSLVQFSIPDIVRDVQWNDKDAWDSSRYVDISLFPSTIWEINSIFNNDNSYNNNQFLIYDQPVASRLRVKRNGSFCCFSFLTHAHRGAELPMQFSCNLSWDNRDITIRKQCLKVTRKLGQS